jgi:hypothetical protein
MNLNVIKKKNPHTVRLDWSAELFDTLTFSDLDLETIVLTLIDFEKKKSVKDIAIVNYKGTPIYITISRKDVSKLVDWLLERFTEKEKYEMCHQLNMLRYDNN